ncbi:MAG: AAA family ATPase, partial [Thermomicrobiales bacterium]
MVDGVKRPDAGVPYIFVSYASADRERVTPIVETLRRAGIAVWLDQHSIAGGENYAREITEGIEYAAALVLMCSAASLASRNVRQEVGLAWKYERPYLPLLLEPVAIPKEIEYFLEMAQWIEILDRPERDWLPQVLAALQPMGVILVVVPDAPPLAGREREQALLQQRLDAARAGNGGLVLIGGEAGIGKTTLAESLCADAERHGAFVLEGHCFDLAETPPYGQWIDLFAHLPAAPSLPLPPVPDAFAQRVTVGAVASQMALFVAVEDFLRALAGQRPVVVLLDDLHWADPASLDLLRFLTRSVATLPLLLLATYRSDELTRRHPLYQILPQLAREAGAERIDLGRLDDAAVGTLVAARYGLADADASRLVAYLQSRAEGNALFVGELLRSLEETGALRHDVAGWALGVLDQTAVPPLLRQVIDGRVGRLDAEAQRLLAVAAVIGHEVPLAIWAMAGEVDDETILMTAEQGLDAQVLVETVGGEGVRFAHALIRETLYEGVPSIRRRLLHRGVGEALAAAPHADPDAVAMHFQQAGDGRAVPWLVRAGERAQLTYAWLTAIERYETALALLEGSDEDIAQQGWLRYRIGRLRRYRTPE